jgi:membrane associated rhomboid family serine protease
MDIQNRFAFDSQTHEWFTLFTSSFLHNSQDHLMNNVLGYLIGSFALYLAFRYQSDTKSLFFLISACVLIVPFVSSIVVYFLAPTILLSRGFSNIVFAIVGLFPAATLMFMKSRSWFVYFVAWLLLEVTAYLFFTSQPVWAVILLFGYVILFSFWGLKVKFFKKEHYSKQVAILYYLIIAPFILLLLGFPPNLIVDGSLVNEVAHYVGFQVGVAVGLVYLYKDYAKRALTKFNSLFNLQNKQ